MVLVRREQIEDGYKVVVFGERKGCANETILLYSLLPLILAEGPSYLLCGCEPFGWDCATEKSYQE